MNKLARNFKAASLLWASLAANVSKQLTVVQRGRGDLPGLRDSKLASKRRLREFSLTRAETNRRVWSSLTPASQRGHAAAANPCLVDFQPQPCCSIPPRPAHLSDGCAERELPSLLQIQPDHRHAWDGLHSGRFCGRLSTAVVVGNGKPRRGASGWTWQYSWRRRLSSE